MVNDAKTAEPATHPSAVPCGAFSTDGKDVSQPLANLLDSVQLLQAPTPLDKNTTAGLIDSTTLELTKQIKKLVTLVGGGAAVLGGASTVWAGVKDKPTLAAVAAAGVAVVLASSFLALAMVMNGDVRGRAAVTAQHIEARGYVASAFLETLCCCDKHTKASVAEQPKASTPASRAIETELRTALATFGTKLTVEPDSGASGTVTGCLWDDKHGLRLRLSTGDLVDLAEVTGFSVD